MAHTAMRMALVAMVTALDSVMVATKSLQLSVSQHWTHL